jgi:hypothetical protein
MRSNRKYWRGPQRHLHLYLYLHLRPQMETCHASNLTAQAGTFPNLTPM